LVCAMEKSSKNAGRDQLAHNPLGSIRFILPLVKAILVSDLHTY
jgi:hypothetical protein